MAPNPHEISPNDVDDLVIRKPKLGLKGDEVVISGMSGNFPRSDNVREFMDNLFNNVDMVTNCEETIKFTHPQMPKHYGKLNGMNKFDAQFFRVPYGQAQFMDSMTRKLLENTYGALFDAGVNPIEVAGTSLGVFSGISYTDIISINVYEVSKNSNYMMTGSSKTMMANRISYWVDAKGPSYSVDESCGSSMAALEHAYRAIKKGRCNAAIVTGSNLCTHPKLTFNLRRAGLLCLDGKTKCFDKNADGFVRSEAAGVLFLQRASDAKRIYAEVVHVKGKYFTKPDANFLPLRKAGDIENFLREFYSEVDVSPKEVEYLEAYGAGIAAADESELESIGNIFTEDGAIKVGCVKSNMGHSECASDLCAVTKACLAYHKGKLPANLHYNNPQENIPAVRDGKIQILTENTPFRRGYTAINSFSYTGNNHHALVKGHYKKKNLEKYRSSIPRLVLASGRIDKSVSKIFDSLKSHPVDAEQIALLHNFFAFDISGHTSRGYIILDTNEENKSMKLAENVKHYPGIRAPVWFLYSGMGSQWPGMGIELMKIPTFAASIERCRKILEPKGVDIVNVITSKDNNMFDNILHSFVGIAAIQIGLTDLLKEMGIVPDNIIGHSVGEIGCAYADGAFTAEEMILSSYYRGLVSVETKFIRGLMAAVRLGHEKLSLICPPEIEIACHNSSESSTISGPADIVKKFVECLKSQNIFAKEVQTANIAYHSKYIDKSAPRLLTILKDLIKNPKRRSDKWLCTSAPPEKWDHPDTQYSSAEYFTNNLLNNVYFEEAAKKIPNDAIVIEIAPHGLMQAIVVKSLKSCTHIPLTRRGNSNPVKFLLEAIGKLYQAGLNPKIDFLYPKVEYPVTTETPLLSPLVGWAHDEDWNVATYNKQDTTRKSTRNFAMAIDDDDWSYLKGNVRNGATIFPEAALLVLVWETLAMYKGLEYRNMSVIFENVRFVKELYINNKQILRFTIEIQMGCCRFEINDEGSQIADGFIKHVKNPHIGHNIEENYDISDEIVLTAKDVYMMMRVRGYSYTGEFQSILSSNIKRNKANIKLKNEWITFIDSLIQLNAFTRDHDGISILKFIRKLTINTKLHETVIQNNEDDYDITNFNAEYSNIHDLTRCGGVEIENIIFKNKPVVEKHSDILEVRKFVPHFPEGPIDLQTTLIVNLKIIKENTTEESLKVTELVTHSKIHSNELSIAIKDVIDKMSNFNIKVSRFVIDPDTLETAMNKKQDLEAANLFVLHNVMDNEKTLKKVVNVLRNNSFILAIENHNIDIKSDIGESFKVITSMSVGDHEVLLLRKTELNKIAVSCVIVDDNKFSWLPQVINELEKGNRVLLVSKREEYCGLIGLTKAFRKNGFSNIGLIIVNDYDAPSFSLEKIFYKQQVEKNLTFNILKKGLWGDYYYLPTDIGSSTVENINLISKIDGNIDSLVWEENPVALRSNNLIQVSYAGTSLYDCQKALGKINDGIKTYGMDFSGYNNRGERVMGLVAAGALGNTVISDLALTWPVPEYWSLQDAATVPLPFVHAYYCLFIRNDFKENLTVLVTGGTGALGQAVISICLALNCTVFSTVSNSEKKIYLLKVFPKLKEEYITYSGSYNVHNMVTYYTNGNNCNYVFSCAGGELRNLAIKCVGHGGVFVNVNNYNNDENREWGLSYLFGSRNYKYVNLSSIFRTENLEQKKLLHQLVSDGIAQGIVKPLSRVVYSPADVSKAFRFVSSSKRIGRVLIKMRDTMALKETIGITARISLSQEASYIVICDQSILGVELASWLISRGAKKVVIHQKSNSIYLHSKRETWKDIGVLSALSTENLENTKGCVTLLTECEKLGPVKGIFIVQKSETNPEIDSLQENFTKNFNQKVLVVSNLDKASRKICHGLSNFVVISPSSNNIGEAFAVAVTENICDTRNECQLPALLIHTDVFNEMDITSKAFMSESLLAFFNTLEKSMKYKYNNVITRDSKKDDGDEFMDKISKIIGIPNIETVEETKSLNSFNTNCVDEIRNVINKTLKIDYLSEELQWFSIASLKKLFNNAKQNTQAVKGLRALYRYIENDEIFAAEPIVIMPSKIRGCTNKMEDELDSKEPHLIMVPGFDGHSRIFTSIGERLKIQAITLQLSPDLEGESIREMAGNLLKHIKATFEFKSKFYLLGYLFGVNIALELAAMLEKEGHVGVVYCLDSSPDAVRVHLDSYLGKLTESELQNTVITEIFHLLTGNATQDLNEELKKIDSWSNKVEHCLKRLQRCVTYSHEYQRTIIETTYKRIMLAKEYKPHFNLKSQLVLIKGTSHPKADNLFDDYNLSKYTKQPVKVFSIESDNASAPYDCRVSNIVNKMLEPKLLEEFNKMNLCEVHSNNVVELQASKSSAMRVPTKIKEPNFTA